jgi:hypothetical protein
MAAQAQAQAQVKPRAPAVRLSQRDIDGLLLCGEHYGVPYDLLATFLMPLILTQSVSAA